MKEFFTKCLQKIKDHENYRYVTLLLAGGILLVCLTDFPGEVFNKNHALSNDKAIDTMSQTESVSSNSENHMDYKKEVSSNNMEDASLSENKIKTEKPQKPLEFTTVEDDYFSDAVFIGDSRVVSLYLYSDWKDSAYYCSSGMTLGAVFDEPNGKWTDGNWKENIATALQREKYKKVYIMLGINDMGVGDLDYFTAQYSDVIDQIQTWQPDAIVYVMSILNVSAQRNAQGDYINNQAITARNNRLKKLDNGVDVFYLDINSVLCDEYGCLNEAYTFDGVHLYAKYVSLWTDYLKTHAIVK